MDLQMNLHVFPSKEAITSSLCPDSINYNGYFVLYEIGIGGEWQEKIVMERFCMVINR